MERETEREAASWGNRQKREANRILNEFLCIQTLSSQHSFNSSLTPIPPPFALSMTPYSLPLSRHLGSPFSFP